MNAVFQSNQEPSAPAKFVEVTRYEIREFGIKGSIYSRPIFRQLVERKRAMKIVKRLKSRGRDVIAVPMRIKVKGGAA